MRTWIASVVIVLGFGASTAGATIVVNSAQRYVGWGPFASSTSLGRFVAGGQSQSGDGTVSAAQVSNIDYPSRRQSLRMNGQLSGETVDSIQGGSANVNFFVSFTLLNTYDFAAVVVGTRTPDAFATMSLVKDGRQILLIDTAGSQGALRNLKPGNYSLSINCFVPNPTNKVSLSFDVLLSNQIIIDTDGDGVPDTDDECPNSDLREWVDTGGGPIVGFENTVDEDGCSIQDKINESASNAETPKLYFAEVRSLALASYADGRITAAQVGELLAGAGKAQGKDRASSDGGG